MADMKRTPEPGEKESMLGLTEPKEAQYPWGLQLTLEEEELAKLGMAELPAAGATLTFVCKARVTRTSTHTEAEKPGEGEGAAETERCVSLQITDMELGGQEQRTVGARLYGA